MKPTKLLGVLLALGLLTAACGSSDTDAADTSESSAEQATTTLAPVTTTEADTMAEDAMDESEDSENTDEGEAMLRVISLSATATESLFAIGAGEMVVAVDDQSNYPADAPQTDLSAFTPNVESIAGYEPDLVVMSYDPGGIVEGLEALGIEVLMQGAAVDLDDAYAQIEQLGAATGHIGESAELVSRMQVDIATLAERAGTEGAGGTFFHEVDNTLYSVTSSTFAGQLYIMLGLTNIADAVDPDGEFFGYPQLSAEYIVEQNPDFIFLADAAYGESLETVQARAGWENLDAVQNGRVIDLDADLASRWGPRIPEFLEGILNLTVGAASQ